MDITKGQGGAAWNASRMSIESYAAAPPGTPAETLGAEVISASLSLGSLGTLRGGTLSLRGVPSAWNASAWPRLVRVRLHSEHGAGYVAAGLLRLGQQTPGELTNAELTGIESIYLDQPGTAGGPSHPMDGGTLTPGGVASYGIDAPAVTTSQTRREALDLALAEYPSGEAGVTADLAGVIGRPESAPGPVVYPLDGRAYALRSLGYSEGEYITDLIYQAGPEYPAYTLSRGDVPPFAPRRTERLSLDPATERVDEVVPAQMSGTLNAQQPVGGSAYEIIWIGLWNSNPVPSYAALRIGDTGLPRELRLRLNYTSEIRTAHRIYLTLRLEYSGQQGTPGYQLLSIPSVAVPASGVFTQDFLLPPELWHPDHRAGSWLRRVWVVAQGDMPEGSAPAARNSIAINSLSMVVTREYDRRNHAAFGSAPNYTPPRPAGWFAPYATGPTYEFSLPGVHVPPYRVAGLPGGLTQHVAGAVVTWNRGEASTRLLTGALPYPGQRRRG